MYPCIKQNMRTMIYMEGSVNYHAFKCTAEGEGKPYEGVHTLKINVIEGGPLPFAFDILAKAFQYGNKVFINYPKEIPDFFKQSFPEGFTWERILAFEDGGTLSVSQETSLQGDCFICNVKVIGTHFPPNGPVMQKKTCGWESSNEIVFPRDGGLVALDVLALKLVGGGHLSCTLNTTFRSKKKVTLPPFHFHSCRLERIKESEDGDTIEQYQCVIARYSDVPSNPGKN